MLIRGLCTAGMTSHPSSILPSIKWPTLHLCYFFTHYLLPTHVKIVPWTWFILGVPNYFKIVPKYEPMQPTYGWLHNVGPWCMCGRQLRCFGHAWGDSQKHFRCDTFMIGNYWRTTSRVTKNTAVHSNPYILSFFIFFSGAKQRVIDENPHQSIVVPLWLMVGESVMVLWRHTNSYWEAVYERLSSERVLVVHVRLTAVIKWNITR